MSAGCIIFVDIDDYMSLVRSLTAIQEKAFLEPIRKRMAEAAKANGYELARSFGDGFLLVKEEEATRELLKSAASLIAEIRDALKPLSLTFKSTAVAGTFQTERMTLTSGNTELVVCGPAANYAGKHIARLAAASVLVSWPIGAVEETFEEMEANEREVATVALAEIGRVAEFLRPFKGPPKTEPTRDVLARTTSFGSNVKQYIFETITLADDKAKATLAISTALLAYLFDFGGWPHIGAWPITPASQLAFLALVLSTTCLFFSAVAAFFVLLPRTGARNRGLFFFGSIVAWSSASEYLKAVRAASADELDSELNRHNFDVSNVATQKYQALRCALLLMGLGIVLTIAYFFLSWLVTNKIIAP